MPANLPATPRRRLSSRLAAMAISDAGQGGETPCPTPIAPPTTPRSTSEGRRRQPEGGRAVRIEETNVVECPATRPEEGDSDSLAELSRLVRQLLKQQADTDRKVDALWARVLELSAELAEHLSVAPSWAVTPPARRSPDRFAAPQGGLYAPCTPTRRHTIFESYSPLQDDGQGPSSTVKRRRLERSSGGA